MAIIDEGAVGKTTASPKSKEVKQTIRGTGPLATQVDEAKSSKAALVGFQTEAKVATSISPMYAPYFGNIMRIHINGIAVAIPCNGQRQMVPATFADEIANRVSAVDRQLALKKSLHANTIFESRAGDIPLTN